MWKQNIVTSESLGGVSPVSDTRSEKWDFGQSRSARVKDLQSVLLSLRRNSITITPLCTRITKEGKSFKDKDEVFSFESLHFWEVETGWPCVVSFAAVHCLVTQRGGALRDETKKGCAGD